MPLISWNESLSVGVAEIDQQHQKLIAIINDLNDAMRQGKSKDVMSKIISGLISYTQTHFGTEENYFAKFQYPDTAAHKAEHAKFVAKAVDFRSGFDSGKIGLSVEVLNFLSDWLTNHIKGTDKKYGPFLNQHGLK